MKVNVKPGGRIRIGKDIVLGVLTISDGQVRFALEDVQSNQVHLPPPAHTWDFPTNSRGHPTDFRR
jgi:hypothetical protein